MPMRRAMLTRWISDVPPGWTAMIPLGRSKDAIYEYACHEGNLGMLGILKGARAEEKAAAAAGTSTRGQ